MPRISLCRRLALAISGLALVAACTPDRPVRQSAYVAPGPTNAYEPTPVSGPSNVMTSPSGMTVYVYDRDSPGQSTCYDACAAYWPPVYAPAGAVPAGGLTLVHRGDGRMQWATSEGMPLYTFVDDRAPGDMRGNNIDGSWHVVAVGYGSTYRSGYVPYGYPYNGLATVTEDGAAVTIQPDTNSAVLTVVNAGAQVRVLDETSGSWTHVEANGQDGFIRTSALR